MQFRCQDTISSLSTDDSLLQRIGRGGPSSLSMTSVEDRLSDTHPVRSGRKERSSSSFRSDMKSLLMYSSRRKSSQQRLERACSNSLLEKVNELRELKVRNGEELEKLEETSWLRIIDIKAKMEKMRDKATFARGCELDLWNDEDLERVEGAQATNNDCVDWNAYEALGKDRLQIEMDASASRIRLIQEGIRLQEQRDYFVALRLDLVKSERQQQQSGSEVVSVLTPLEEDHDTAMTLNEMSNTELGKLQEDPLITPLKSALSLGNQLMRHFGAEDKIANGTATGSSSTEVPQSSHGYSTRKRVSGMYNMGSSIYTRTRKRRRRQ